MNVNDRRNYKRIRKTSQASKFSKPSFFFALNVQFP